MLMEVVRTWLISTMMMVDRTPMNAICGMTKVLKDSHMSSEQRECVQIISSSAKALLSLLNNILDFSKIEAGKTEIHVHRLSSLASPHIER
jgi:signal transduction histidine kinase